MKKLVLACFGIVFSLSTSWAIAGDVLKIECRDYSPGNELEFNLVRNPSLGYDYEIKGRDGYVSKNDVFLDCYFRKPFDFRCVNEGSPRFRVETLETDAGRVVLVTEIARNTWNTPPDVVHQFALDGNGSADCRVTSSAR